MKLLIHGVHLSLTAELKEAVREQILEPLQRLIDDEAAEVEVYLRDNNGPKGGLDQECSITLHLPGLSAVHVSELTEDVHKSIQLAHDRIVRVAKRVLDRRRDGTRRDPAPPVEIAPATDG
jgi:putative sigma-54 modulation protein